MKDVEDAPFHEPWEMSGPEEGDEIDQAALV